MSVKTITKSDFIWVNIDKIDDESLTYLKKNYKFHPLDYADLSSEQQVPKIDSYDDYLFIVLKFPYWKQDEQKIQINEIDFFIGEKFLITIQHNKSKDLKDFFYRCMNNRKVKDDWMHSSGFLLYRLVESLFQEVRPILNNLSKQLTALEQEIYEAEPDSGLILTLSIFRRNILQFRRILDPQRNLIASIINTKKNFLTEDLHLYFDDVTDYLNKIWAVIETYKETVDGFHITVESLLNRRTNKVISALTAISVSLLPLTLLSGIYGMNISGLPFADNPKYVWAMFVFLAVIILLTMFIMKKKKAL